MIQQVNVVMYKCSNGQKFEDRQKAVQEEVRLFCQDLFEREGWSNMSQGDAADIVAQHVDELMQMVEEME